MKSLGWLLLMFMMSARGLLLTLAAGNSERQVILKGLNGGLDDSLCHMPLLVAK